MLRQISHEIADRDPGMLQGIGSPPQLRKRSDIRGSGGETARSPARAADLVST
ncbi:MULTISPECIES: hypothetical protein [unclassified Streptomyces]|uniref:hypothetical protein n=1 Tax=unclassified Streptomyces TaxID=2593676 RepID=UPI002DD9FA4F|nr:MULTISPECIES: hypothetical protein [unclassified Streptomyces]WSC41381.1 hypothetical protein OHA08_41315 [Streptomyces sp. NBC_01763]